MGGRRHHAPGGCQFGQRRAAFRREHFQFRVLPVGVRFRPHREQRSLPIDADGESTLSQVRQPDARIIVPVAAEHNFAGSTVCQHDGQSPLSPRRRPELSSLQENHLRGVLRHGRLGTRRSDRRVAGAQLSETKILPPQTCVLASIPPVRIDQPPLTGRAVPRDAQQKIPAVGQLQAERRAGQESDPFHPLLQIVDEPRLVAGLRVRAERGDPAVPAELFQPARSGKINRRLSRCVVPLDRPAAGEDDPRTILRNGHRVGAVGRILEAIQDLGGGRARVRFSRSCGALRFPR